ncbi:PREDICTED: protein gamma response 1-like isoform X2 [Acropora digitifera]|uniref:protein gamma response 1-like isoform X2 n=1 Tax=Acropora digitifera TaxID=70779 RepID=UPI00077AF50F|nr:PREDICTED: protein gamma response 1-like isoform X2 [Acropora digitifera]
MKERHKNILQRRIVELVNDLEPEPLLLYFYSKNVIDEDDMDEIQSYNLRRTMSKKLILKLMKKGSQAFSNLVDGLQNTQPFLACSLLQEENKRLSELEIELENLKTETEELKTKLQCFEENERLENKRLSELEIELENLKMEREELKTKLQCFEENERLENKRLSELEIELENLKMEREELKTKLQCFEEKERLRPLSSVESHEDDFEEPFDDSSGRQSRRVECTGTSRCQKSRTSTRLRNKASKSREYHFRYEGDFDNKGVIYYLGFNAGVNIWKNPARVSSSGVKVTYCDKNGSGRGDPENILEYFTPRNSSTRSGWCLDLGDYYTLRLTDYTVRQLGSNDRNFLQNFKILGRLCEGDDWNTVDKHDQVDWRSQRFSHMFSGNKDLSYKTKTWSVKGEIKAYRQFKIAEIKDRSTSVPGTHSMSLAGIELYGVLTVPYLD